MSAAETALNAESDTVVAAFREAELLAAVGHDLNGTFFAPTNEAFVALLEDLDLTEEELLEDTELLTEVMIGQ